MEKNKASCAIALVLAVLFLAFGRPAGAQISVTAAGQSSNFQVTYTEPTEDGCDPADAACLASPPPLTDLKETHVTYDKGTGEVECAREAATALTGGGSIQTTCSVPSQRFEVFDVGIRAYASDLGGEVSESSAPVQKHVDRRPPGQIKN